VYPLFSCIFLQILFVRLLSISSFVVLAFLSLTCTQVEQNQLYRLLTSAESGVTFNNRIVENDSFNVLSYIYIYNGGGVATGDLNNDGLPDLFFSGNQVSSALYLNLGKLKFTDVTEAAGLRTNRWCTGVNLIDINQDGWLDLYVCAVQPDKRTATGAPNLLYINEGTDAKGVPHFREAAAEYGLDDTGYSTQSVFFDYDLDGDLDCYLLTNALEDIDRNINRLIREDGSAPSTDRLYRNDRTADGQIHYTNVSKTAGINIEGWGLGVAVNDFNADGWPDIYVANDFLTNDLLWINNQNGSFTNRINEYFRHQCHNGMGVDVADFNNDALPDLVELDMMPNDNLRQKTMFGKPSYDRFYQGLQLGYQPQFVRNMLQLNTGRGFSEIGQLAGVYKTDWSWAALFFDIDNDGWRDLGITNGYYRDVTDLDFIAYNNETKMFGSNPQAQREKLATAMKKLGVVKKHNYLFHNQRNLRFADQSKTWGFEQPSCSNGFAYADLDADGDLDLVTNNLNDPAFVYENRSQQVLRQQHHFLRIRLQADSPNRDALGATIRVYATEAEKVVQQHHYQTFTRGYKSAVEPIAHFGMGQAKLADSIVVQWPDGKRSKLQQVALDQVLTITPADGQLLPNKSVKPAPVLWFAPADTLKGWKVSHVENTYNDFNRDKLLWHQYSRSGPGLACGDVDGNGLDDLLLGGAVGQACTLMLQQTGGRFVSAAVLPELNANEKLGLLLFDCDADLDLDLYVANGGNERGAGQEFYRHQLLRNNGRGRFISDPGALPDIRISGACVRAADADRDGDLDLFVGGRIEPTRYPSAPRSYFLRNNGGVFEDATAVVCPDLVQKGMITNALWTDADADGWLDLLVCGEWMEVLLYYNRGGKLDTAPLQVAASGWWNSLHGGDFDRDGDTDYVAGNWGLNTRFAATPEEPVRVYAQDMDKNGSAELFLTYFIEGQSFNFAPRDQLAEQCPLYRRRFPTYADYGKKTFDQMHQPAELAEAFTRQMIQTASVWLENKGNQVFAVHELPIEAQFFPVFGLQTGDFNQDGYIDMVLSGNHRGTDTQLGWYDAGQGLLLAGNGQGQFRPIPIVESGLWLPDDVKSLLTIAVAARPMLVAGCNNAAMAAFEPLQRQFKAYRAATNHTGAHIRHPDGRTERRELYWGEGHLSQSSRVIWSNGQVTFY
jgi:enediyne biosynthesis protein E4